MNSSSTNTLSRLVLSSEPTTKTQVQVSDSRVRRRRADSNKNVQNAVYSYIRAVRALNQTKITTVQIASALALSVVEVNKVLSSLKEKGVRTLNG
jgi:CRP-like cAMP-binding protein